VGEGDPEFASSKPLVSVMVVDGTRSRLAWGRGATSLTCSRDLRPLSGRKRPATLAQTAPVVKRPVKAMWGGEREVGQRLR
jgi:hypothetical protein